MVIDTNLLTNSSSEHDGLSGVITVPSCLELEHGLQSDVLFEQYSLFSGGLSQEALAGDPEEASYHSVLATLSVSDGTSCDDWTQSTHSTNPKGPSSAPIAMVSAINYSGLLPPNVIPWTSTLQRQVLTSQVFRFPRSRSTKINLELTLLHHRPSKAPAMSITCMKRHCRMIPLATTTTTSLLTTRA